MAGECVLVVEDNEMNMKLFRDVLAASGYRTLEATTGREALELAAEHEPELVLMDIRLPDGNGADTLSKMRADRRTASLSVVAITAQAMHGDRERFLAAGFDDYIAKPVDVPELLTTVRRHCTRRAPPTERGTETRTAET